MNTKHNTTHLLQNASQVPLALTADKFFASFTNTCNDPLLLRELDEEEDDDLTLNLRKFKLPPFGVECGVEVPESGGMNFNPTIISPLYTGRSSNGSLWNIFKEKMK